MSIRGNKISAIGDINIDLIIDYSYNSLEGKIEKYYMGIGGSTLNSAIILSNSKVEVSFCGNIGCNFPEYFITELQKIFSKFTVHRTKEKNGLVLSLLEKEDRKLFSYRGSNKVGIKCEILPADILLLSSYYFIEHTFNDWNKFKYKVLSIGDSKIEIRNDILENFDIVIMNEEHFKKINRKHSKVLKSKEVIITLGKKGCIAIKNGNEIFQEQKLNIVSIDSTGAGDAFLAGYVYARLIEKQSLKDACKIANLCGGIATTIFGTGLKFKSNKLNISELIKLNK